MLTVPALQMVAVLALVIAGVGFIVIVTVFAVPGHAPAKGVTVYITFCALVVPLTIVLFNVFVFCVVKLSPVVFVLSVAIQVNVAPTTLDVSGMFTVAPVQIVAVPALVTVDAGLTVTVTVWAIPEHPPAVGATV